MTYTSNPSQPVLPEDKLLAAADGNEYWLEPKPLLRELPPANPFPVDALGSVLSKAAAAIEEATRAPLAMCAQSVMASAALAAQPHADILIDGRQFPISCFFITVGESGERKSSVDKVALKAHRDYQASMFERYKEEQADYEKQKAAYDQTRASVLSGKNKSKDQVYEALAALGESPAPPLHAITLVSDITIEGLRKHFERGPASAGLFSDEGGTLTGGVAMNKDNVLKTIANLCKFFDGTDIPILRGGDGVSYIRGKRLSMHLMIQPVLMTDLFNNVLLKEQGFFSRILSVFPESTIGTRFYREFDPSSDQRLQNFNMTIRNLLHEQPEYGAGSRNELTPKRLKLSADAKSIYIAFHDSIEKECKEGKRFESIRGFAAKTAEQSLRLAGVLALVDNVHCQDISVEWVDAGITLADFYLNEHLRLFQSGAVDPKLMQAQKLLSWLQSRGKNEIAQVEVYRHGPTFCRSKQTAEEMFDILRDHGWVKQSNTEIVWDGAVRKDVWKIRS